MEKFKLRSILYYIPLIILIILSFIIKGQTFTYIIRPLFFLIYAIFCHYTLTSKKGRYKLVSGKQKLVIIIVLFYLIFWFLSGLVFAYTKNIYSREFFNILRNTWSFILILITREYTRMKLIQNNKSRANTIVLTILFTLTEISLTSVFKSFSNNKTAFEYLSGTIFPILVKNILLTFLNYVGGYKVACAYIMPLTIADIMLPILPDLDWFFKALSQTVLGVVIGISVYKEEQTKVLREHTSRKKKKNKYIVIDLILVVIFALFVAGIFKYQPVAVLTYSMKPVFERGDVVIIEKLEENEKQKIKVGDVVEYASTKQIIIHRVIKIEKDKNDKLVFTTKGDFNNSPDSKKVSEDQVRGIARAYIPKVGYPTVWLNEFFNKKK